MIVVLLILILVVLLFGVPLIWGILIAFFAMLGFNLIGFLQWLGWGGDALAHFPIPFCTSSTIIRWPPRRSAQRPRLAENRRTSAPLPSLTLCAKKNQKSLACPRCP